MTDITNNRIYVFDKAGGSLKNSYNLGDIDQTKNIHISSDGSIWIATENSIWEIHPN
jgi:hypothetical protein